MCTVLTFAPVNSVYGKNTENLLKDVLLSVFKEYSLKITFGYTNTNVCFYGKYFRKVFYSIGRRSGLFHTGTPLNRKVYA